MNSTTDYKIFQDYSSNREVDEKHVRKLVRAIHDRNLLHVNPIIVTKDMRVIDGQHRLAAAEILGVPIYYIEGNINRKDISRPNSNQKNWSTMDYVNFYTIEGVPEFVEFSKLFNHYPKMKISALMAIASEDNRRSTLELKNGMLNIFDIDIAKEISEICYSLNKEYGYIFVFDSRFPIALKKTIQADNFQLDNLYDKIAVSPRSFVPCHTIGEYCKMIADVYNYRLSKNLINVK